jgi:hypothetical protein
MSAKQKATAPELAALVGKDCLVRANGTSSPHKITDARAVFGRVDVQVEPVKPALPGVAGEGKHD